jgi:hypothetical protein
MAPNINRNAYKFWVLLVVYQLLAYVLSHEICVEHLCHQTCQGCTYAILLINYSIFLLPNHTNFISVYFGDDKYTLFNLGYHFGNDRDEDVITFTILYCIFLTSIL